ncbi:hypothetical protein RAB80_014635 [Fusarium oxysporum f. sp. vasinfectum]|nr:hypothetical protein RAB80_014635 [Fusarium oxysporum f. sp. vasinfectum]
MDALRNLFSPSKQPAPRLPPPPPPTMSLQSKTYSLKDRQRAARRSLDRIGKPEGRSPVCNVPPLPQRIGMGICAPSYRLDSSLLADSSKQQRSRLSNVSSITSVHDTSATATATGDISNISQQEKSTVTMSPAVARLSAKRSSAARPSPHKTLSNLGILASPSQNIFCSGSCQHTTRGQAPFWCSPNKPPHLTPVKRVSSGQQRRARTA